MKLLGIDIGTSNIKVGLFREDGRTLFISSRPNNTHQASAGYAYYEPWNVWRMVVRLIEETMTWDDEHREGEAAVAAIGIASMAETGLLLDRMTGAPKVPMIPWFDPIATRQAQGLSSQVDLRELFYKAGIRPTYKCSLAKLLWLLDQDVSLFDNSIWLSAADYICYRMTDLMTTDYTLAGRTFAFDLDRKIWDETLLAQFGLSGELFPDVVAGGSVVGPVKTGLGGQLGALAGTPVAIAGHDHICGAFGASVLAGGVRTDLVFDSIGTAEALVGAIPERSLGEKEFQSGLSYGLHIAPGYRYWVGGLPAAGGSIEWLRGLISAMPLDYHGLDDLVNDDPVEPGEILYFPYLAGSGSPHSDSLVRGAFSGLRVGHSQKDLYLAVLEGTAYEIEFIRQEAQKATGLEIQRLVAAGGGTRNRRWIQIRADVTGCQVDLLPQSEATLLGAALAAGLGCGAIATLGEVAVDAERPLERYEPDPKRHEIYRDKFQEFLRLQAPLRGN